MRLAVLKLIERRVPPSRSLATRHYLLINILLSQNTKAGHLNFELK